MSKKLRILNNTHVAKPPRGFVLDIAGQYIAPGRQVTLSLDVVPVILEEWAAKGWAIYQDADDKTPISKPAETAVTPGTVVKEVSSDDLLEEDFDLSVAKEASLASPVTQSPAILGDLTQQSKAKVTLGSTQAAVHANALSPIPGDKPVVLGDSDKFTVRAPRTDGVGAVIAKS